MINQAFSGFGTAPLLSILNKKNQAVDEIFYDVGALTQIERSHLSAHDNPEGSVVVVQPNSKQPCSGDTGCVKHYLGNSFLEAIKRNDKEALVEVVVVAGVGSSALGTAALARAVANHVQKPVAGVVSGLGMEDVMAEALGGWFIFGMRSRLRGGSEKVMKMVDSMMGGKVSTSTTSEPTGNIEKGDEHFISTPGNPDSKVLLEILQARGKHIKLLVGHSKGNFIIENALEGLVQYNRSKNKEGDIPNDVAIVTMGAVIPFPDSFTHVRQVLGGLDSLGLINSMPHLERIIIPNVWHSLNPAVAAHMPLDRALELAGVPAAV